MKTMHFMLVTAAVLVTFAIGAAEARAQVSVPIAGEVAEVSNFTGAFEVQRFVRSGDQVLAVGTLTGTLTNQVTGVTANVVRPNVRIPLDLTQTAGTCEILNLVLGPLDLDLLGLQVHLDQVVLVIEAESGQGNLLGNLLCAVANLLNPPGPLQAIASLLNQILAALG